ncbi:hypothetical protein GCM10022240_15980 [Microbacterium kribbense]|uniref:L,D-TPase catalytic domain-containing protein n=1 Tax=Microbacterium kribbense TaxID=433645 RepID=A0ABP7GIW0_9MICO
MRRKRHLGLWIGTPLAVALVGVIAASLVLIAPGTAVAGVQVGGMTAGAAAAAIQSRLNETTVELTGHGVHATLTGAQLGAKVDAQALAKAAFADHPMWNLGGWFSGADHAPVTLDADTATAALRAAAPALFEAPVDATVTFDAKTASYASTPAAGGTGADLDVLATALQDAFAKGEGTVPVAATQAPVAPAISTDTAKKTAAALNTMLDKIGFYVGDERTVPVDRKVAASWLTVTAADDGFTITADQAAIANVVGTLEKSVNRPPQNGTEITDRQGTVLRVDRPALDGRTLGDTSGIAAAFAGQLAGGDGVYRLPVTVTKASTTKVSRHIVVDLSRQMTYLYQNGALLRSYLISSGTAGHATPTGYFRVFAHVVKQDMGCFDGAEYCTKNVPWVTYFAPDVGFHGTYWHHNFGHVMSHGCVNMPIDIAKFVYDWAPTGLEVTVQN